MAIIPRKASSVDVEIGRRVRLRRGELGLSQETLASMIGVTFQQVQKYEQGKNRIAASMLLEISTALEVDVTRLLPGADEAGESQVLSSLTSREAFSLVAAFAQIESPKSRSAILNLAVQLANEPDEASAPARRPAAKKSPAKKKAKK